MKATTADLLILQVWHYRNDQPSEDPDGDLLARLVKRAGKLARAMLQGEKYGMQAIDVATMALEILESKWVGPGTTLRESTISDLRAEIARCRAKFPKNDLMLAALTEEIGELAEALESDNSSEIREEALQVACVAVRIAEEGDNTFVGASVESQQK